jgi:hypothetical protein
VSFVHISLALDLNIDEDKIKRRIALYAESARYCLLHSDEYISKGINKIKAALLRKNGSDFLRDCF